MPDNNNSKDTSLGRRREQSLVRSVAFLAAVARRSRHVKKKKKKKDECDLKFSWLTRYCDFRGPRSFECLEIARLLDGGVPRFAKSAAARRHPNDNPLRIMTNLIPRGRADALRTNCNCNLKAEKTAARLRKELQRLTRSDLRSDMRIVP